MDIYLQQRIEVFCILKIEIFFCILKIENKKFTINGLSKAGEWEILDRTSILFLKSKL